MFAVELELGPLVGVDGVLDRQGVQLEFLGDGVELLGRGLVEAHPHERVVVLPAGLERVVEVEHARPTLTLRVRSAVDDHRR